MRIKNRMLLAIALAGFTGCTANQQTVVYQSLASIEAAADTSYNGYVAQVIKGTVSTNSLPTISKAYNDLHNAVILAAVADQAGTNALAPANLTIEAADFSTLITTAIANK